MNKSEDIVETIQGSIKILRYNRPAKKNAIDVDMYQKMTKILNETAYDDNIIVTVVTGTGDYYSSGNDLNNSLALMNRSSFAMVLKEFIKAFITFPKLLVAIVNGPAIGIAATTLPLCDLVFADEKAFFQTPFSRLGITPEGCSTVTFRELIGQRKAIEMLLFNHKMTAQEALRCGFVNEIFKPEELQTKVWDKIIEVSKLPQHSVIASKKLIRNNINELLVTNEREMDEMEKIWASGDYKSVLEQHSKRKSKM